MKIKITFLLFFFCFESLLFSQTDSLPREGIQSIVNAKKTGNTTFNGNQTIATSYTKSACGLNYTSAGNVLYARTGNNFTLGIAQPASFSVSGIPVCGIIEKAFLYVGTSGASVNINASITNPLNGNFVFPMSLIGSGPDKNWGYGGSYTYRADITSIIAGNGAYLISGIPTSTVNTGDDANGATLLVIYSDRTQNFTGNIVIADGSLVNAISGGSVNVNISGFDVCGSPSLTTNFMLIDDLQKYGNTDISLNSAIPNYTQLAITDVPWMLISDPGVPVFNGQSSADFGLINSMDTVGLLMAGFYFQSDCLICPQVLNLTATTTASCLATASVNVSGGLTPYTYLWPVISEVTQNVSGLSAGVYTATASDSLGCLSGTTTVLVTTPAPQISATSATVCIGYGVNISADPAASYTWYPSGAVNNFTLQNVFATPLATTIFSIDYTNALGCSGTATAEVFVTNTQTIAISNSTLCAGQTIGLSTNSFTGDGYNWQGPAFTSTLQNPSIANATTGMSGTYSLNVTTIPGCTTTGVSEVTVSSLPNVTINSNSPICANFNLNLSSGGGANYSWTGPGGFTSAVQNPTITAATLAATGVYSVTASFGNGCARSASLTATVNPLPVPSVNSTTNVCIGLPVTFSVTTPFTSYQWVGPNGFTSNAQITGIAAISVAGNGVYTVTVTDGNNCNATTTTTMAALLNPTVSATGTTTCYGTVATLTANGTGFYQWLGPNGYNESPILPTTTVTANNLSVGVYTVILISLTNQCKAQSTTTLATIPLPSVGATGTAVCLNSPGILNATGGVLYSWTGPNSYTAAAANAMVPVANAFSVGDYTALVTAANTCTAIVTTTLGVLPLPTVTAIGTVVCLNEPATLSANGALSYTWAGPPAYSANGQSAFVPIANALATGIYTVFGKAVNTCTGIATAAIVTMSLPIITSIGATVCLNQPALLQAAGGLANTTGYKWTGPGAYLSNAINAVIPNASNVAPLVYTVVGTAPNSCTNINTAVLATIPLPNISATNTTVCYGYPVTISANGANTYTWTGPNSNNTGGSANNSIPLVDSLSRGLYLVFGTSLSGCTNSTSVLVSTKPLPIITASTVHVCYLQSATLTASGGISNTYVWTGPQAYTSAQQSAFIAMASAVVPQTYTVKAMGANSCTNAALAVLKTYPLPQPSYNATATVCLGSYISIEAFGAKTYSWTGPRRYSSTSQNINFAAYNTGQGGTYTLNVVDSVGCKNFTTVNVAINSLPSGILTRSDPGTYCVPFCSDFKIKRTTASPIITTNWTFNKLTYQAEVFNYCKAIAGTDFVIGTFVDALGCSNTLTFAIQSYPRPEAVFTISPDKPIESSDEVYFTDASRGNNIVSWNWLLAETSVPISAYQNSSYLFDDAGEYKVALIVENVWGCKDTAIKTVVVKSDVKLFVPNTFTPGHDGINDVFKAKGRGMKTFELEVYDRWGQRVFVTDDFDASWDGTFQGKDCPNDIYVWKIFAKDNDGKKHDLTGHVTLFR